MTRKIDFWVKIANAGKCSNSGVLGVFCFIRLAAYYDDTGFKNTILPHK